MDETEGYSVEVQYNVEVRDRTRPRTLEVVRTLVDMELPVRLKPTFGEGRYDSPVVIVRVGHQNFKFGHTQLDEMRAKIGELERNVPGCRVLDRIETP